MNLIQITGRLGGETHELCINAETLSICPDVVRIGHNNRYVTRRLGGRRTILISGYAPTGQIQPFTYQRIRPGNPPAMWEDAYTVTIQTPGAEPSVLELERTTVTMDLPETLDASHETTRVVVLIDGYRKGVWEATTERVEGANCMLCGTEEHPGRAITGRQGNVVVICDPCAASLVPEKVTV